MGGVYNQMGMLPASTQPKMHTLPQEGQSKKGINRESGQAAARADRVKWCAGDWQDSTPMP